ncbi:K(+)-transporting ATPase subunit F [Exiguobacterium sp. PBE]|uniref:K+-transporting ATPase, F subunit n=1 Tax=Exiguobacterium sp. (strain ATCC BAA-1283 / AT1b) TaxID=360911 RepID=C4KYL5_EXISA|nr:K+-transporting ATPase, F subunit [Exiguobacterium sp. AT1b]QLQ21158.1 MAG: K(+)-transporting ATPase subunit F [Paracoccaceae bacterium]QPI68178.1 K(+)-transporting ATPase subunit F [Exiguobacterium sp. PBE]
MNRGDDMYIVLLAIGIGYLAYLTVALLKPEKF